MDLKDVFVAVICATVSTWGGLAVADEYHPDDFLHLDPSRALLSPTPLGPVQHFVPGPLDATVDRGSGGPQAAADTNPEPREVETQKIEVQKEAEVQRAEPKTSEPKTSEPKTVEPKTVEPKTVEPKTVGRKTRVMHARAEKPRAAARIKLARRHSDPLNAQAFDTRIQAWPCNSGGICNWKR
ncbi:hypothetical protein [Bradyrhizobium erythrophlei]|jgi:hypothetical protein|uniref:Uncharacterized protein n=1 Tax=Bradyrhizobium erythrophlei TaxID=1437360 RepID=A0A1M5KP79_9BRAD|nr:hypothetical protein [Bradyrhizobium erythrophlei]SHG54329.1 hypothetical protein SAMN05443248_1902 [Bradyrhizobium erythrophlei]